MQDTVQNLDVPLAQRMNALSYGNAIRLYRADCKKKVAAGELPWDFFLERGPHDDRLRNMKLRDALLVMPGLGPVKVDRMLRRAAISPVKTLGGLSSQSWERLYAELRMWPVAAERLSEPRATVS